MRWLYSFAIHAFTFGLHLAAFLHPKARKWVAGRHDWRRRYRQEFQKKGRVLWVHAASLGEFEQGRPIIEAYRQQFPDWQVVLTFFSPSGYEVRRHYPQADFVAYLPADTRRNASDFLDIIQPDAAIFVKYEFWFNYLRALQRRGTPTLLVSALFRDQQPFFQPWGGFWRRGLTAFTWFFVQDHASARLLQRIDFQNVTMAGDTRIDRVLQLAETAPGNDLVWAFVGDAPAPLAPPSPPVKGGNSIAENKTNDLPPTAQLHVRPPFTGGQGGAHPTEHPTQKAVDNAETSRIDDPPAPLAPPSPPVKGGDGVEENKTNDLPPTAQLHVLPPFTGGQGGAHPTEYPKIFIAGSAWEADEKIFGPVVTAGTTWKVIVAPHEPSAKNVQRLLRYPRSVRYTQATPEALRTARLLVIDNVGMLNTLYRYGTVAYIGGGFGSGIHNTLEPAAFGLPIIFGPKYTKFAEAQAFVARGAAFPVRNAAELSAVLLHLADPARYAQASLAARNFLAENRGATAKVLSFLEHWAAQE